MSYADALGPIPRGVYDSLRAYIASGAWQSYASQKAFVTLRRAYATHLRYFAHDFDDTGGMAR